MTKTLLAALLSLPLMVAAEPQPAASTPTPTRTPTPTPTPTPTSTPGAIELFPFPPAHAADQAVVSTDSLMEELGEYRSIGEWHRRKFLLEVAKAKAEKSRLEFERAKALRRDRVITEKAVTAAFGTYQSSVAAVWELEYETNLTKEAGQIHKVRVLEYGNPGADYRKQIAKIIADRLRAEEETVQSRKKAADNLVVTAQALYDIGKDMHAKGALATAELESREFNLKEAKARVKDVEEQIAVVQKAAAAFEDNSSHL